MDIFLASMTHLESLSILFDRYRVFYEQPSDVEAAQQFLKERFTNNDSVLFIASDRDEMVGFTQLYPSFSSVSMKRVWILNDLYVKVSHRRKGIATSLIRTVEQYARDSNAVRVVLATQISNVSAKKLYEARGYIHDKAFDYYTLSL
ncbi:GNAT family N-acetyltransferase [Lusitaniella coriacea LEGE 07157]|uniref:GNAT family N-acetyltransferase n=1 Tax=Lusitaniella coriacea LEGE 07157 TaxID=945747 RepID=A0A8J7DY10_9CYAN|nr:GNAT family N-acetyltransferase [Lusitaniella coriacea LEGE 07157]